MGYIPTEICYIKNLEILELPGGTNTLTGYIPSSIGFLSKLTHLCGGINVEIYPTTSYLDIFRKKSFKCRIYADCISQLIKDTLE
jgi:hypothetical protein